MKGKKIQVGSYVRITKDKIYYPSVDEMRFPLGLSPTSKGIIKRGSVGRVEYKIGEREWKVKFFGARKPQDIYEKYLIEVEEKEAVIAAL